MNSDPKDHSVKIALISTSRTLAASINANLNNHDHLCVFTHTDNDTSIRDLARYDIIIVDGCKDPAGAASLLQAIRQGRDRCRQHVIAYAEESQMQDMHPHVDDFCLNNASPSLLGLRMRLARDCILHKNRVHQLNEEVQAQKSEKQSLLYAIPDLVFLVDPKGSVLSEAAQKPITDYFPDDASDALITSIEKAWRTGDLCVLEISNTIGDEVRNLELRVILVDDTRLAVIARDITSMRQMEARLLEQIEVANGLESVLENMGDGVVAVNMAQEISVLNSAAQSLFSLKGVTPGTVWSGGTRLYSADGSRKIDCEGSPLSRALRGEINDAEMVIRPTGGGKDISVWASARPIIDSDGVPKGAIAIYRDTTLKKKAEENRKTLEIQLYQAQRLESIGQLAAGVAHEINTPLQFIGDNVRFINEAFDIFTALLNKYRELLRVARKDPSSSDSVSHIESFEQASDIDFLCRETPGALNQTIEGLDHVSRIVKSLKEFSHPSVGQVVETNVNKALERTITLSRNEWKFIASINLDLEKSLPEISCYPGELNQVFLNLVINATQAIEEKQKKFPSLDTEGQITIATRKQGDHVEIRVKDNGCGIPDDVKPRIFDPFFTTKDIGKGSGQGLALGYVTIVEQHGGTIDVDSTPGEGTTFIVRLPILPPAAKGKAMQHSERIPMGA